MITEPSPTLVGTGDIEVPVRRHDVDGITPDAERVKLMPIPGEDWAGIWERAQQASKEKRDWLAEQLALGQMRTPRDLKRAARRLGCSKRAVAQERLTKGMAERVAEKLRTLAVYATAEALPYVAEMAKKDTTAFDKVAKIGKVLEPAGIQVQQNVLIDKRNGGDDEGDRAFFRRFQERAQRRVEAEATLERSTPE